MKRFDFHAVVQKHDAMDAAYIEFPHVILQQDDEPRMVETPPDLLYLLEANPEGKAIFAKLSYTHRKEYVQWIEGAKRNETRTKRLNDTLMMLMNKIKLP